jgi:sporulation protein YlmC with PRC-barrel domain
MLHGDSRVEIRYVQVMRVGVIYIIAEAAPQERKRGW